MFLCLFFVIFANVMNKEGHVVILSLASNVDAKENLEVARKRIGFLLSDCRYSKEHWTKPVNTDHKEKYLNQAVKGRTHLDSEQLNVFLKKIEESLGREHDKSGIVTIDIDLLEFDKVRFHEADWERDYVKKCIKEI